MGKKSKKEDSVSMISEESNDEKKKDTYIKPSCQKFESLKNLVYRGEVACGGVSGGGGGDS